VRQQYDLRGCYAGGRACKTQPFPPSTLFDKGLPGRCTLSTSAPVILLTIQAGAVSPVASDLEARSADHVLILLSVAVCGRVW
jgi:hypothetical protein